MLTFLTGVVSVIASDADVARRRERERGEKGKLKIKSKQIKFGYCQLKHQLFSIPQLKQC